MATNSTNTDRRDPRISDNDEDASRRVRARVSRACTRCRARKDRCDGRQPQCFNCIAASQPCSYVAGIKKRGLPEGYVRGMEKLWAVMIQKVHGLDDTVRQVVNDSEEELVRIWNHYKHGNDLHTAWKESRVLSELERLLSRVDQGPALDLKRKRDREDDEDATNSSNETPSDIQFLVPDFKVTEVSNRDEDVINDTPALSRGRPPSQPTTSSSPGSVPLPSSASVLLEHYFKYTHCWFPVLDRPYTLKKMYEYTRPERRANHEPSDLAYMWAMCAYSEQQTMHTRSHAILKQSSTVDEMRDHARRMIPSESGPFSLGHVQALLLLVLLDIGIGKWTSAWILVGFAVRALLDVMDSGQTIPPKWMATLQGCFILDTIVSMRVKRPPHLRSEHLPRDQFLDEDGYEEWEPWSANRWDTPESREPGFVISCFNRLTELCMIANGSFRDERSQRHMEAPPARDLIVKFQDLTDRYPLNVMDIERRPPHQMVLQACHFATLAMTSHLTGGIRENPRWKFLENLELFEHSWNAPENCGIPSIMAVLCHLVYPRSDNSSIFLDIDAPALLSERFNQVLAKLSVIWPEFESLKAPLPPNTQILPQENAPRPSSGTFPSGQRNGLTSNTAISLPPPQTNFWPVTSLVTQTDHMVPEDIPAGTRDPPVLRYQDIPNYHDQVGQAPRIGSAPIDYGPMSIDIAEQGGPASFDSNLIRKSGAIGTSPSFNGDEIDTLFHEMAQLDTTQWSTDRTQGLKDFGFADDSTFEAFCNDPDRLMLPGGLREASFNIAFGSQATFTSGNS
ncbi:uncharacterized protein Z518_08035 [Rhinocladiella mackenziei CBS 650.93]|uniref:Zn(2)-C6 fungal-type domain-containing protein n=1 Tax=Rhinocladiella mackenziei CBS 650.93 TaxID=1442369 RepID=A0A0D2IFQ4_9EURO|nr:uncharacterized protein Z518_08035 [Rhinocladiella mackenziei CBS 650.93]KIX02096.1 hypothetical protein Z518_08035 [Rhinocladiella mackenziei CBS 650.93]